MISRPVVITGLGPITAFGPGVEPLWNALLERRSAIGAITRYDASAFPCPWAAELPIDAFNVKKVVPKSYRKATKVMCRDIELAVGAAACAVEDAGLTTKATDPDSEPTIAPRRFGCHIGAGLIASDIEELAQALMPSRDGNGGIDLAHWGAEGMNNLTPLWLLKYLPNMLACHVTIVHDCQGPSNTITCCEASALLSLGESLRVIQRGAADACLTGGAEYKINPLGMVRQQFAGRLAQPADGDVDPTSITMPFDESATGSVLGEGGGILVIEAEETARDRGARVYAKIGGYAASQSKCDDALGLHISADDTSLAAAMQRAIDQAGISAADISAIAPFGSGIANSDAAEARAIHAVFSDRAASVPLITTTPNTGNCTAGNAAVALIAAARSIAEQKLPGRLNTTDNCRGLCATASETTDASLEHVLVMTTSQGGQNAVAVLSRCA